MGPDAHRSNVSLPQLLTRRRTACFKRCSHRLGPAAQNVVPEPFFDLQDDDQRGSAGRQLIGCIKAAEMHLDFIPASGEIRGPTTGTELASDIPSRFALDFHRILWGNGRSTKQSAMVLSAVEAMTDSDPVRASPGQNSNVAAVAVTHEALHICAAFRSSQSTQPWTSCLVLLVVGMRRFTERVSSVDISLEAVLRWTRRNCRL